MWWTYDFSFEFGLTAAAAAGEICVWTAPATAGSPAVAGKSVFRVKDALNLFGRDRIALFCEILRSARMIRDGGDGSGKVQIQFAVFCVAGNLRLGVVEQILREVVDGVLGDIVACENDCADRNRGHIAVGAVDVGGNDVFGVVVRGGAELFDMLVVQRDEVNILRGGKVGDGSRGSAGDNERSVNLAVLDVVGAVAEGLIGRGDIRLGQAVSAENVDGVEVNAGACCADRGFPA